MGQISGPPAVDEISKTGLGVMLGRNFPKQDLDGWGEEEECWMGCVTMPQKNSDWVEVFQKYPTELPKIKPDSSWKNVNKPFLLIGGPRCLRDND